MSIDELFGPLKEAEVDNSGFDDPIMEMYSVGYSDGLADGEEWGMRALNLVRDALLHGKTEEALGLIETWNHMR